MGDPIVPEVISISILSARDGTLKECLNSRQQPNMGIASQEPETENPSLKKMAKL
jgi:hypothetical protein